MLDNLIFFFFCELSICEAVDSYININVLLLCTCTSFFKNILCNAMHNFNNIY